VGLVQIMAKMLIALVLIVLIIVDHLLVRHLVLAAAAEIWACLIAISIVPIVPNIICLLINIILKVLYMILAIKWFNNIRAAVKRMIDYFYYFYFSYYFLILLFYKYYRKIYKKRTFLFKVCLLWFFILFLSINYFIF
jgi:hypothetical protein